MSHKVARTVLGILLVGPALAVPFKADGQTGSRHELSSMEKVTTAPSPAAALQTSTIQIPVQCGNPAAKVKTIGDALTLLGNLHPAVLLISGTCRENVV